MQQFNGDREMNKGKIIMLHVVTLCKSITVVTEVS